MELIQNNPYRILGISASVSEKELQRRISLIRRYLEVGKQQEFSHDFQYLGEIQRNVDQIQEAANSIENPVKKILYSLFWFIEATKIDAEAFSHIKENNIDGAVEIWESNLESDIVVKTASMLNLSTLYLSLARTSNDSKDLIIKGLQLKSDIFSDEIFDNFKRIVAQDANIQKNNVLTAFLKDIKDKIIYSNLYGFDDTMISKLLNLLNPVMKEPFEREIVTEYTSSIILKIDQCIENRTKDPSEGLNLSENLFENTENDLKHIGNIYSKSNINYSLYADKISQEMNQCIVEYNNSVKDDIKTSDARRAISILNNAKSIVVSQNIRTNIVKGVEFFENWIENEPQLRAFNKVKVHIEKIGKILDERPNNDDPIKSVRNSVTMCKLEMTKISSKIGYDNKIYMDTSNAIVVNIINKYITFFNIVAKQNDYQFQQYAVHELRLGFDELESLEMNGNASNFYNENIYKIREIDHNLNYRYSGSSNMVGVNKPSESYSYKNKSSSNTQLYQHKSSNSNYTVTSSSSENNTQQKEGCYIATMVYGYYDEPHVMKLRSYRDNHLLNCSIGRVVVKAYYYVSPKMIRYLEDKRYINHIIKLIVDKIIQNIEKIYE